MQQNLKPESKLNLALCGGIGAIAPDILILYSKRWTAPEVTFNFELYIFATVMYIILAGFVSCIFPYRKVSKTNNYLWMAFCIGVTLPIVIAGFTTIIKSQPINPRGGEALGRFIDLISF